MIFYRPVLILTHLAVKGITIRLQIDHRGHDWIDTLFMHIRVKSP